MTNHVSQQSVSSSAPADRHDDRLQSPGSLPSFSSPISCKRLKYQIQEDIPMDQASSDALGLSTRCLARPIHPSCPRSSRTTKNSPPVLSMERLEQASGLLGEGRGLYRKHCATCHGITGNGRGITAAVLNPYPRDYRMGIFKFKSTKRGSKPTRDDMAKLIVTGSRARP